MKNIIVRGKKAQIIGGHLLATEEICAKKIGSPGGGTETTLEVGIDPRAKNRLIELQKKQVDYTKEYDNTELDIQTLEQQKKMRKKLPVEKEEKVVEKKTRNKLTKEMLEEKVKECLKNKELAEFFGYTESTISHLKKLYGLGTRAYNRRV